MTRRRKVLLWIGSLAGVLLLGFGVLWLVGRGIERTHEASVSRDLDATPEAVWALITEVEKFPQWREGLKKVEVKERQGDRVVAWVEHSSFGPMPLRTLEFDPPRRMVGRIDSEEMGFGGTWTWEIAPRDGGCTLTITERGHIDSPIFRVLAKHVFGYDGTIRRVQADLAATLAGRTR